MRRQECESIRPLISAYMDGELSPEDTRELHAHLAECAACSDLFDEYRDLRDQLRHLPPTPPPPVQVHQYIRQRTVEHTPTRTERWFGLSAARLSLSAAAAIVLLIVVSAYALVHGYQQGSQPGIAQSLPASGAFWPIQQPIEITFSKPMDQASVSQNLKIIPMGEATRLPRSWRGNTLVIGASASGGVPLLPDTDYTVVVLGTARDTYGNLLGQPWVLQFHTSAVVAQQATVTPTPTAVPTTAPAIAQTDTTPAPRPSQAPTTPVPPATSAPSTGTSATTAPPQITPKPAPPRSAATSTPVPTPVTQTPAATPTPSPPPTAVPTATPTVTPATPTVAATPATPTTAVTGAFGSVYWAKTTVQSRLGAPATGRGAYTFSAAILSFQRGTMYERFDTQTVYIFLADGTWTSVADTWTAADGNGGGQPQGQSDLWIPSKNFWKAWTADPTLATSIGYATSADAHYMQGQGQDFAGGTMLYSDTGFVYVVYSNNQWEVYPDTSGHGALLTPTPSTTGTPASTSTATATPTSTAGATATPVPGGTPTPAAAATPTVTPTSNSTP